MCVENLLHEPSDNCSDRFKARSLVWHVGPASFHQLLQVFLLTVSSSNRWSKGRHFSGCNSSHHICGKIDCQFNESSSQMKAMVVNKWLQKKQLQRKKWWTNVKTLDSILCSTKDIVRNEEKSFKGDEEKALTAMQYWIKEKNSTWYEKPHLLINFAVFTLICIRIYLGYKI